MISDMISGRFYSRLPSYKVLLLALCQGLHMSGLTISTIFCALVGFMLAPDPRLATVPLASVYVVSMLLAIPISYMMFYFGRKVGFIFCQAMGVFSSILAAYAIIEGDFWLFMLGMMLLGFQQSGAGFFRFAAAELADADVRGTAGSGVSLVIAGGVLAAVLGPELAKWSYDKIELALYAGAFLCIAALSILNIVVLSFINFPKPKAAEVEKLNPRPLKTMLAQPSILLAIIAALVGYSMMTLLMTSTPLAMQSHGFHPANDIAVVIQWHVFAMFAPGFVTGYLIQRFGVQKIILCGILANILCVTVSLYDVQFINFWLGLFLLGIGWNFMYVGGTTMLAECHEPHEKAKIQGFNDFCVSASVASASLLSGFLFSTIGWDVLNFVMLGVILSTLVLFISMRSRLSRRFA